MPQLAKRFFLASCACLLPLAAGLDPSRRLFEDLLYRLSACHGLRCHHRLTAADVAKTRMPWPKSRLHLRPDPAINKDKLMKQALANNKVAYKMMAETQKVDPGVFCRSSMNDLMSKLRDIDADATVKKSGS